MNFTENALREIIEQSVEKGVASALIKIGVDVESPLEMQRDMQHLRRWRKSVEAVQRKGAMVVVSTLVVGGLGALWMGFRDVLNR